MRILASQAATTLVLAVACYAAWGPLAGKSALAGGAIGTIANLYMTLAALRPAAGAAGALGRLYFGQLIKVGLTVASFVIVARSGAVSWPALLVAYIATLMVFWIVPAWSAIRSPRRAD